MNPLSDFHIALTFLTRLGRAQISTSSEISRSMYMYPYVGALVGTMLTLVAMLPLSTWVLALLVTSANLLLTRGLHWDGWADLWDGWGSGATGDRFWSIVKDSHIGAFGVMGLILGLGMETALFERAIAHHSWIQLGWAFMFGRFCCLFLAYLGRALARPGLGQNALAGATPKTLAIGGTGTALSALLIPPSHVCLTLFFALCALGLLLRLGHRQKGMNGDFLGAAIIAGEICALLPLATA